jgi:hypothetical protein
MSLYRSELASFDMTGYDAGHAEGFIRLLGLPLAAASQRGPRKPPLLATPPAAAARPSANGAKSRPRAGAPVPAQTVPAEVGHAD